MAGVSEHIVVERGGAGDGGGVHDPGDETAFAEGAPEIDAEPAEGEDHEQHAEQPRQGGAALVAERSSHGDGRQAGHGENER